MLNKIQNIVDNWSENIARKKINNSDVKVGKGKEGYEKCRHCPFGTIDCSSGIISKKKNNASEIYTEIKADLLSLKRVVGAIQDRRKESKPVEVERRGVV